MMKTRMELPPKFPNRTLANILTLSDNDRFLLEVALNRLEKGQSDPSPELIAAFNNLLGPIITEVQINTNLVTPFLTDS